MVDCGACGTAQPEQSRFCNQCGAKLASRCLSCNAVLAAAARFCNQCGTPVVSSGSTKGRPSGGSKAAHPLEVAEAAARKVDEFLDVARQWREAGDDTRAAQCLRKAESKAAARKARPYISEFADFALLWAELASKADVERITEKALASIETWDAQSSQRDLARIALALDCVGAALTLVELRDAALSVIDRETKNWPHANERSEVDFRACHIGMFAGRWYSVQESFCRELLEETEDDIGGVWGATLFARAYHSMDDASAVGRMMDLAEELWFETEDDFIEAQHICEAYIHFENRPAAEMWCYNMAKVADGSDEEDMVAMAREEISEIS